MADRYQVERDAFGHIHAYRVEEQSGAGRFDDYGGVAVDPSESYSPPHRGVVDIQIIAAHGTPALGGRPATEYLLGGPGRLLVPVVPGVERAAGSAGSAVLEEVVLFGFKAEVGKEGVSHVALNETRCRSQYVQYHVI